jgi:hypothetical protein
MCLYSVCEFHTGLCAERPTLLKGLSFLTNYPIWKPTNTCRVSVSVVDIG